MYVQYLDFVWCGASVERSASSVVVNMLPFPALSAQLLELHSSVLKPDLDLSVGQVDTPANLQAALPRQIHVEQKLLLQLQRLVLCVWTALLPSTFSF